MKAIGYHTMLFNYMTSLLMELFTGIARSMTTIIRFSFAWRSLLIDLLWWVDCFKICFRL